jgi:hypothetical protein
VIMAFNYMSAKMGLAKIALIWDIELTWVRLGLKAVFSDTMTIYIFPLHNSGKFLTNVSE